MKQNQLKELLKHIISEVTVQSEMIANKDAEPDVMGFVNVEENIQPGTLLKKKIYNLAWQIRNAQARRFSCRKGSEKQLMYQKQAEELFAQLKQSVAKYEEVTGKPFKGKFEIWDQLPDQSSADRNFNPDTILNRPVAETMVGEPHGDKTARAYKEGQRAAAKSENVKNPYTGDLAGYWEAGYNDGKQESSGELGEGLFDGGDAKRIAQKVWGNIKKIAKISHPSSNAEFFSVHLEDGELKVLRKNKEGDWFYLDDDSLEKKYIPVEPEVSEQSTSGGAGAFATPFAFKPTGGAGERRRKKKKKHVREMHIDPMQVGLGGAAIWTLSQALKNFLDRLMYKQAYKNVKISTPQQLDNLLTNATRQLGLPDGFFGNLRKDLIKKIESKEVVTVGDLYKHLDQINKSKDLNEGSFLQKVKDKIRGSVDDVKSMANNLNEMKNWIDLSTDEKIDVKRMVKIIRSSDEMVSNETKEMAKNFLKQKVGLTDKEIERIIFAAGTSVDEKTLPDGKYVDDMEDGHRSSRIAGIKENIDKVPGLLQKLLHLHDDAIKNKKNHVEVGGNTYSTTYIRYVIDLLRQEEENSTDSKVNEQSTSGAVGQAGGLPQVPAWGTKNKLGSPKGIAGSAKLGYKVVKSITNEGQ